MGKKKFLIQTGAALLINAVMLFVARLALLIAAEAVPIAIILVAGGYVTASVLMVRWTGRVLHFPVTTLIFQFVLSLALVLSLYSEASDALSSEEGFMVFLGVIILLLFVAMVAVLPILMTVVFLITLVPSLIAKRILKKAENTAGVIPAEENTENTIYELKGSTENDKADT